MQKSRMVKEVGKLSKPVKKMMRRHSKDAKNSKAGSQLLTEWNARNHKVVLSQPSLASGLLTLVLRPWRWELVRLQRVKAKTKNLSWPCTKNNALKALLPEKQRMRAGWMLRMSEKRGKVRRVVVAQSNSLNRNNVDQQAMWDEAWNKLNKK